MLAETIHRLLTNKEAELENLTEVLCRNFPITEADSVTLSDLYDRDDKSLSDAHRQVLNTLDDNAYSDAIAQNSRHQAQKIFRIFHLEEHILGGTVAFREVEEQLKNELFQKAMEEESLRYRQQLRTRFRITDAYLKEMIPAEFQPFSLT
jgi:hypothetical protein